MTSRTTSFADLGKREPAQVIPFPSDAAGRARRVSAEGAPAVGRILLFTGIRYERMPDLPEEAMKPKRKRS